MIIANAFDRISSRRQIRRPRVAVLGEFSAGKSSFINLMTGGKTLRTQVTATQMPAVWLSHGTDRPYRVDLNGQEHPVNLSNMSGVSVSDTAYIRIFMKTPILERCDLIDTPGNSDPNIPSAAWERIAEISDVAVWCSSATQAWRQSEVAAWRDVPQRVRDNSILLLTRADKLTSNVDRKKVLRRVTSEAENLFSAIHMVSLLDINDAQIALRDVIALCRNIDVDDTDTMDTVTDAFARPQVDADIPAIAGDDLPETDADLAFMDMEASVQASAERDTASLTEDETEWGFATNLWYEMTSELDSNDPDALDRVFGEFLAAMDAEVAALRHQSSIKAAS